MMKVLHTFSQTLHQLVNNLPTCIHLLLSNVNACFTCLILFQATTCTRSRGAGNRTWPPTFTVRPKTLIA
jgi:hypothetical protein